MPSSLPGMTPWKLIPGTIAPGGRALGLSMRVSDYAGVDPAAAAAVGDLVMQAADAYGAPIVALPVSRYPVDRRSGGPRAAPLGAPRCRSRAGRSHHPGGFRRCDRQLPRHRHGPLRGGVRPRAGRADDLLKPVPTTPSSSQAWPRYSLGPASSPHSTSPTSPAGCAPLLVRPGTCPPQRGALRGKQPRGSAMPGVRPTRGSGTQLRTSR